MPHSWIQKLLPEIELNEPTILPLFVKKDIELSILRLDQVHENISGNKLFKLIYFLQEAKKSPAKKIITFGGAYSNHLAATAFACLQLNIDCIGIVRGEESQQTSPTLNFCKMHAMKLQFISRGEYKNITEKDFLSKLHDLYGGHILLNEGGFSIKGKEGAALISQYYNDKHFSHVCLPVGTATTFAGLVDSSQHGTKIIGFSVLKNLHDVDNRFRHLKVNAKREYTTIHDYHFGGYAKKTPELINFMNEFYAKNKIPLDFVYTGKMMFGIYDLIEKDYFPPGSKILCIHTGGLQGNQSLEHGVLTYN